MGLIGTLVGLVQMLTQLDDPSKIGPAMAVALLTTLYGAVLATTNGSGSLTLTGANFPAAMEGMHVQLTGFPDEAASVEVSWIARDDPGD